MYESIYIFSLLCINTPLGTVLINILYLLIMNIIKKYNNIQKEDMQKELYQFKMKNRNFVENEIIEFKKKKDLHNDNHLFNLFLYINYVNEFDNMENIIFNNFSKLQENKKENKEENKLYNSFIQYGINIISEIIKLEYYINNKKINFMKDPSISDNNINDKIEIITISKNKVTYMYQCYSRIIDIWIKKHQSGDKENEEDIDTILLKICSLSEINFIKIIYPIILTKELKCQKYLLNQLSSGTKKKLDFYLKNNIYNNEYPEYPEYNYIIKMICHFCSYI